MDSDSQQDSPLSITSNIVGILTFVVAIAAAIYARLTYLRNSDDEYFRVKTSLSWYKTESTWLSDLLRTLGTQHAYNGGVHSRQKEYQMYAFVMDDLINLEQRLLDLVTEVESRASAARGPKNGDGRWTLVPSSWQRGTPSVGMAWMSVRTKALELVRQREALTARVQFLQMSMLSSRLGELEARTKMGEKMDGVMRSHADEFRRLETLMQQLPVRGRLPVQMGEAASDDEFAPRKPYLYSGIQP
jgi:N-acetylglucosaminylphosphatidylinositol deacetylase